MRLFSHMSSFRFKMSFQIVFRLKTFITNGALVSDSLMNILNMSFQIVIVRKVFITNGAIEQLFSLMNRSNMSFQIRYNLKPFLTHSAHITFFYVYTMFQFTMCLQFFFM